MCGPIMSIKSDLNAESATYFLVEYLEKEIKKISKIVENYKDKELRELDFKELFQIDEIALRMSLSCRNAVENNVIFNYLDLDGDLLPDPKCAGLQRVKIPRELMNRTVPKIVNDRDEIALKNLPVSVKFENKILTVHTPYVFRRAYGKDYTMTNFLMANFVNLALKKWLIDNGKYDNLDDYYHDNLDEKLVVIVTRYTKKYNRNDICDNDNIETGRIINTIFSNVWRSDSAQYLDYYVRYRETDDETKWGTEFKVMSQEKVIIDENNNA